MSIEYLPTLIIEKENLLDRTCRYYWKKREKKKKNVKTKFYKLSSFD